MLKLFILFTAMPVIELMLLIQVGERVGAFTTVGLCLATGFVGASLARSQGAGVLRRIQLTVHQGGLPARELVDAMLILVAGVVLLTPGFVTDFLGLVCLIPPTRALIRGLTLRWIRGRLREGTWRVHPAPGGQASSWVQRGEASRGGSRVTPEIIPPEIAPRAPRPTPPDIIDV